MTSLYVGQRVWHAQFHPLRGQPFAYIALFVQTGLSDGDLILEAGGVEARVPAPLKTDNL